MIHTHTLTHKHRASNNVVGLTKMYTRGRLCVCLCACVCMCEWAWERAINKLYDKSSPKLICLCALSPLAAPYAVVSTRHCALDANRRRRRRRQTRCQNAHRQTRVHGKAITCLCIITFVRAPCRRRRPIIIASASARTTPLGAQPRYTSDIRQTQQPDGTVRGVPNCVVLPLATLAHHRNVVRSPLNI